MAPHKQQFHLKANRPSINMSLSFDEDMDDVVEEDGTKQHVCSPPRAFGSRLASACSNTPKMRRLFETDSVARSPFRRAPRCVGVKKPLDPLENLDESTDSNCSFLSIQSLPEEGGGRKRSSLERRLERTSSDGDGDKMYFSPRISPNSYITMDGRFVQSKNPFSSPMMTDTPTGFEHPAVGAAQAALAPSLPTSFYNSRCSNSGDGEEDSKMRSFLPPRHRQPSLFQQVSASHQSNGTMATEMVAGVDSFSLAATGYPDHLSKFTGSPIPEHRVRSHQQPYATLHDNATATQGSLRKVRRINRTDDVVAATGHHLSRLSTGSSYGARMSIDTSSDGSQFDWDDDDDELSPTEVAGFPFAPVASPAPHKAPPPTPVKQRPSQHSYSSIRRSTKTTPGPPILTRKGLRTPHPGSVLHSAHEDDEDEINPNCTQGKSRFYSDFDVIGELGKGSFGTVYKVLSRLDGCMYAIKAAHRQAKGAADRGRMLKEVYALAALSDQADTANFHIVRYHQAWMEDDRLYIQTELCSGTLGDEMQRGPLSRQRRYKLLREILLALDFLHRNFMCHLDIKPENIFLKNDQYKLGDFGLVTRVSSEQEIEEGDSRYMSMELLSGDHSDLTKSDIFSLGATMYEICLGRLLPMNGPEWQDIRAGRLSPLPIDQDTATIIHGMMDPVAANRPTPRELLKHPELLSDEQKALHAEKTKVLHANIQLAAAALAPPPRRPLQRANTWSGTSMDGTGSIMAWL